MLESSTLLQSRKPMSLGPHSSPEQAPVSFQLTIMFFLGFSVTTTPRGIPPASCRPGWWPQPPAPRRISGTRWPSGIFPAPGRWRGRDHPPGWSWWPTGLPPCRSGGRQRRRRSRRRRTCWDRCDVARRENKRNLASFLDSHSLRSTTYSSFIINNLYILYTIGSLLLLFFLVKYYRFSWLKVYDFLIYHMKILLYS